MAQKVLILINDAPYGTEKAYNAFRLALQIQKDYESVDLCRKARQPDHIWPV